MDRLKAYQELADPSQEPIVLLPDLAPDDGLPVGMTMITSEQLLPFAIGMDPGCGFGCWRLSNLRARVSPGILAEWVAGALWEPVTDETTATRQTLF
jgi:hypothetical protein